MGWLSVVGMGWKEEGVFAVGENRIRRAKFVEDMST